MADLEPEWDSRDSNRYQDGFEQGRADARDGGPFNDHAGSKPRPWTEGYRDGYAKDGQDGGIAQA